MGLIIFPNIIDIEVEVIEVRATIPPRLRRISSRISTGRRSKISSGKLSTNSTGSCTI